MPYADDSPGRIDFCPGRLEQIVLFLRPELSAMRNRRGTYAAG